MSLPDKVSVTATMSVIRTGPQHMSAIASLKEVTCFVESEKKLIGFPCLAGEKGADGTSASVEVGTTTTLPAGSSATVVNVGTDQNAILNFGIPKGADGTGADPAWGNITGALSNQTDLQTALNAKANTADLGDLASKDTADYTTDITNKPTLGALAAKDTADYATDVTNKPTLGTMASVNDASSDDKTYGRKNGSWVEVTGGGGGGGTWGSITGTLSDQTDLQDALDSKADSEALASEFDETETYYNGDFVTRSGKLYRFLGTHNPGAWSPYEVSETQGISYLNQLISTKAPIASPTFTGTPNAPTPSAGDASTKIATTYYVDVGMSRKFLHISMASTSSLGTISNAKITTTMRVVNIVWGNPANVLSDVTWNTNTAGQLVLSGTLGGATSAEIDLIDYLAYA